MERWKGGKKERKKERERERWKKNAATDIITYKGRGKLPEENFACSVSFLPSRNGTIIAACIFVE